MEDIKIKIQEIEKAFEPLNQALEELREILILYFK